MTSKVTTVPVRKSAAGCVAPRPTVLRVSLQATAIPPGFSSGPPSPSPGPTLHSLSTANDVLAPTVMHAPPITQQRPYQRCLSATETVPKEDTTHTMFRWHRQHARLKSGHLHGCWCWCGSGVVDESDNEDAGKQQCWCYPSFLLPPLPCMVPCYQGVCSRGTLVNTFFLLPRHRMLACVLSSMPRPSSGPPNSSTCLKRRASAYIYFRPLARPRADCLSVW
jgi:hypothetical protein